ncbi:ribosomal protein S18-alanine N-acetyltransferase [Candidatus Formimonas warabiya]|uniref:Ribosomal-protein-alanine N-acetyltransferase n=1 Tax=Formimonas warabiya TaxID=1761012 RepID=A0A3G1KSY9_FORW1|nr:ribosomal protein S18-alanine N-acetyltransferase [Candidatus Formimonas warabiya]ATW25569.1 ribosomal-protein-alanine N-acetyltransferase [Candidatus Formimonas warabiya]
MIDEIVFYPLKSEHLDQVLEIEQVSFPTPWSKQSFTSELLENALAYYCGCFLDGKLIGYGGMWVIIDEAHITNIAVHPYYRGKRVGEAVIFHLMAQAMAKGAYKMTLEVRPSNISAQKLYLRLGFNAVGRRKGYYTDTKEDAIIMWKDLIDQGQSESY